LGIPNKAKVYSEEEKQVIIILNLMKQTTNQELKLGIYQHYKGTKYIVIGRATHSETLEKLVIYITLYENKESQIWVRPIEMFLDEVEKDGKKVPRFKHIGTEM
jgi:hypothetical protein